MSVRDMAQRYRRGIPERCHSGSQADHRPPSRTIRDVSTGHRIERAWSRRAVSAEHKRVGG
eukprot:1524158-Rhodomonas_salina.2